MITEGTDDRIAAIDKTAQRELQLSIINSKLPIKNLFHRKCVFLLHHQFDGRKQQCCVMHSDSSWIVWKFENQPPYFENDEFNLTSLFPMFGERHICSHLDFPQELRSTASSTTLPSRIPTRVINSGLHKVGASRGAPPDVR